MSFGSFDDEIKKFFWFVFFVYHYFVNYEIVLIVSCDGGIAIRALLTSLITQPSIIGS